MTHHNEYLLKFVESGLTSSTTEEEIIKYVPAQKVDLGPLNFLYSDFDVVTPVTIKGKKRVRNFLSYRTEFRELYRHYKKWCSKQGKPYLDEPGLWKEILCIYPHASVKIEYMDFPLKDKDGKNVIDKDGNLKTVREKIRLVIGIKFNPDGIKTGENHHHPSP